MTYIGILFIGLGLMGMLHQKLFTPDTWFNWGQFWHHEGLIAICLAFGFGLIIGSL